MDKYLSIITNFGCHYTCPYCIVKENNLHIPKTTIEGLEKLCEETVKNKCNWISISGGGDPLHNLKNNYDWYDKLLDVTPINVNLELHTSYSNVKDGILNWFNRIVYHIRNIEDIKNITKDFDLDGTQIIRVVFVVDESFTKDKIDKIVELVKSNKCIDELSFRQMIDSNYNTTHYCEEYLKDGHMKDWWYITQGDYNLYYCENKVSTVYEDFKEE